MSTWRFLLDENIDPKVATYLDKEDLIAVHVRDTVGQGADDEEDVLPYAREHDLIQNASAYLRLEAEVKRRDSVTSS